MAEINDQFKNINPADLTPEQAQQIITTVVDEEESKRLKYFQGDHWQDGEGWMGPTLSVDSPGFRELLGSIQRMFIFNNMCKQVVKRHVDAVLAKEPQWGAALVRVLTEGEVRSKSEDEQ